MRGALSLALIAAGLVLGGLLVPASGAQSLHRASAQALVAGGDPGAVRQARAAGDGEQHRHGAVDVTGLQIASSQAVARTQVSGDHPQAHAYAVVHTVSLLSGRVTAYGVRNAVTVDPSGEQRSSVVDGLRIDGQLIGRLTEAKTFPLANGDGTVYVNDGAIGLRVVLDRPTPDYPATTDLRVAIARASLTTVAPTPTPTPTPATTPKPTPTPTATPAKHAAPKKVVRRAAPPVRTHLTAGGYVFPIYGQASVADDFGAPREIGAHQGNDIFAAFGTPIVAVADGTVHKVGTLPIAGNRLWLRTDNGDAFFYCHLSAFSPAAVTGAHVKAGTVLGFVGNTGDAEHTPPHLHFEVHPAGMQYPAVNPHPILLAWQGHRDVAPGAWLQQYGTDTASRSGALVAVRDFIAE